MNKQKIEDKKSKIKNLIKNIFKNDFLKVLDRLEREDREEMGGNRETYWLINYRISKSKKKGVTETWAWSLLTEWDS